MKNLEVFVDFINDIFDVITKKFSEDKRLR